MNFNTFINCSLVGLALTSSVAAFSATTKQSKEVRAIIDKVNSYWQSNNAPEVRAFWDNAAYHTGNMEAYFLTGNDAYREYSEKWAEHNQWKGAKSNDRANWKYSYGESDDYVLFGDWQICFQTYADLYNILPDDKRILNADATMPLFLRGVTYSQTRLLVVGRRTLHGYARND